MRTQGSKLDRVLSEPSREIPLAVRVESGLSGGNESPRRTATKEEVVPQAGLGETKPILGDQQSSSSKTSEAGRLNQSKLRALISEYTGVREENLQSDISLSSLGLDSLSSVELSNELEETMGINVSAEDLVLRSLSDLACLSSPNASSQENAKRENPASGLFSDSLSQEESSESSSVFTAGENGNTDTITPPTNGSLSPALGCGDAKDSWKRPKSPLNSHFRVETTTYKVVEGVEIAADIYVPAELATQAMPVGTFRFRPWISFNSDY